MRLLSACILVLALFCAVGYAQEETQRFGFGADVQKMMSIIVHSLYQNPDIFVRELISNAADALTKQRVQSLKNDVVSELPYEVKISSDREARTVTISDTGVAMTRDELITNLGSLGFSGTKRFLEHAASGQSTSKLIGQFGVGFYSVFLAGEKVRVVSKSDNSTHQYVFESVADGTFSVGRDPRGNTLERGTEVTLFLKPDAEHYTYPDNLRRIISKYSEFIDFPIYLRNCKKEKVKPEDAAEEDGAEVEEAPKKDEFKTTCDWEHVNEQKPIWLRNPYEIDEDEYHGFYKAITKDLDPPMYYSHFAAEGEVEFKSILYVPAKAPFNVHDSTQGLMTNVRLYVRRVFITDEFKDLLPRYLNFIRGVVDSDDLPLNVSREVLQENRLVKVIRKRLTRKVLSMISDIVARDEANAKKQKADDAKGQEAAEKKRKEEADEEIVDDSEAPPLEPKDYEDDEDDKKDKKWEPEYPKFWAEYGKALRLGIIEDPANKAKLVKLLRYQSSKSNGTLTTFEDYVDRMEENQKGIFFVTGESVDRIEESPLLEWAQAENVEVCTLQSPLMSLWPPTLRSMQTTN
jgi:heat shock protein beta